MRRSMSKFDYSDDESNPGKRFRINDEFENMGEFYEEMNVDRSHVGGGHMDSDENEEYGAAGGHLMEDLMLGAAAGASSSQHQQHRRSSNRNNADVENSLLITLNQSQLNNLENSL